MTKEVLKQALEALETSMYPQQKQLQAITAIKSALANEALERKAENARELGLDYEPLEAKDEPVAFKIYKPTPPRHATPNVRDAELPWVYDQDPSSGNVASMWVTPVQTLMSKK